MSDIPVTTNALIPDLARAILIIKNILVKYNLPKLAVLELHPIAVAAIKHQASGGGLFLHYQANLKTPRVTPTIHGVRIVEIHRSPVEGKDDRMEGQKDD